MYTQVMPKAGMAMEEGKIVKWLKKEGDMVERGDVLLEIETDKTNMEVESEYSGILLKIIKNEGETVPVTEGIALIGRPGEKPEEDKKELSKAESTVPAVNDASQNYDVVVVGGGPAGYIAAIKAARLGAKTALIEKSTVGGTCLNRGCIPTKTYLKTAEYIENILHAGSRGIILKSDAFSLDMKKAVEQKNGVVKKLTSGVAALLKSNGVTVIPGTAKVMSDKRIVIGKDLTVTAQKVIFAGGSKSAKINIPGVESSLVLTSDEILDMQEVPKRLAIIGGGVIGVEMATIFKNFGSEVTIVELMDRIVPTMDRDISAELLKSLKQKGITVHTSTRLLSIQEENGTLKLNIEGKEPVIADKALLSIGRVPDMEGVSELDLAMEKGRIAVDDFMKTSLDWVYAPGDINGRLMLAHAAFKMGEIAAINAAGGSEKVDLKYVPSCIYTMPEVGSVGLTEQEAAGKYNVKTGKFQYRANGRALASGEEAGFVKVVTDKKYGEVLGVHIIGPGAAEVINEAAALMSMEITANEIASIIHGHPTFAEAFMEAAADSIGECLHLPKK